ncbi:VOC family protein [Indiicoccus explosivorum]|uniref:VOC family protein n=1 Tax=Indiicoccus explosivorum TaxID=1917864 RepID=UPI000B4330F5|nr:VOC family protein [Indiicoccus explosivorum]
MIFHEKPVTFVGQVRLKVQDLERSLKFYTSVLGFTVSERTGGRAQLTADGKTVLLSLEQPEDAAPKQPRTTGLYHFAVLLPTRADLAAFVRHLAESGIQFGSSDHLVSEALYFSDPDGNGIEVYRDRKPEEWTWQGDQVVMTVDPLDFEELLSTSGQERWKGLPEGTVMGHIHLHVADLRQAEQFYTEGLGLDVVCRFGGQASFISSGKYHHHIGINTWNGTGAPPPSPDSAGLAAFTLVLPSEEERNETAERLKRIGAPVSETGGRFLTEDPSGNRIELLV